MKTNLILVGGSSGLGAEVAEQLKHEYNIIATYNKKNIKSITPKVTKYRLNLEDQNSIDDFCSFTLNLKGKVVIVYLSTISEDNLMLNTTKEDWWKALQVNLISNVIICNKLMAKMIGDKWGRIIFVGSVVSHTGNIGTSIYSTTKHSLYGLSKVISKEYGRFGITSNIIKLGYFNTGLINTFTDQEKKSIKNRIPSKKLGTAEDLTKAIKFMIECQYLNGSTLSLDGGFN